MRIFVNNLPFKTTEEELSDLFAEFGKVNSASIITDRESGRSRGFAFVDMADGEAREAIGSLDGYEINGRRINVSEAQERATKMKRTPR
jgi:RNA recognition motif-containing protein